ncbi:DUF4232 domain-containing protein [bacterium]|nr:DUF4232 domain-containing protein [bacterium]
MAIVSVFPIALAFSDSSVSYAISHDDQGAVRIHVKNHGDRTITLHRFLVVFLDSQGNSIDEQDVRCNEDCTLLPLEKKEFGPFTPPPGTDRIKVRDFEYT